MSEDSRSETKEDEKKGNKKYGFRLTPEEQELAYELKAGMMRKLETQNEQLQTELQMHRKMKDRQRQDKKLTHPRKFDSLSQSNAGKLIRLYERKQKEAEKYVEQLERELKESQDLARRYKNAAGGRPPSRGGRSVDGDTRKITEDDLDDDEAVFKRHVARLAETKSMLTTTPIRVQDVVRKNEVLLERNDELSREVTRLKEDNANLILQVKHAKAEKEQAVHMVRASERNRQDLMKRLEKEQKQHRDLHKSLTKQAADWVTARKEFQQREDYFRWMSVQPISPLGAEGRLYDHPIKKNVNLPRKMHPAEQWAASSKQ